MADKFKKSVRDIQKRTDWSYSFCLHLVKALGYEEVSRAVDDNVPSDDLNKRANEANLAKRGA